MKFVPKNSKAVNSRLVHRESVDIPDIHFLGEEPTDENTLKALEGLLALYIQYCDTRESIADQGLDILRAETFFENGRTIQVGSFKLTVTNLDQLQNNIARYKTKLGLEPEPRPYNGPVNGPEDLPERIAF